MKIVKNPIWGVILALFLPGFALSGSTGGVYLDDFNSVSEKSHYGYAPEPAKVQAGFCIYFDSAEVDLMLIEVDTLGSDKSLQIKYLLPIYHFWGNWLSVRKEFSKPIDLSAYKGLIIRLRVNIASNAVLRVTLSDITQEKQLGDDMWWSDNKTVLGEYTGEWIEIKMPFDKFYESFGEGTRHNDGKLNLKRIVGFDINIISKPREVASGKLQIDYIKTY
jgi:hypothetical protein